jgi:hypothetical protein
MAGICCRDVNEVALFVHKCMKGADAAAVAAARNSLDEVESKIVAAIV